MFHGNVHDRPWGKTLGTLARRGVTGQLTVRQHNAQFQIVFERGLVVAAAAPGSGEGAVALAFREGLISQLQSAGIQRRSFGGTRDWELLAQLLAAPQILRLRRQAIAACVARTFVFEHGDFTFGSATALPVIRGTAAPVGGMIFEGARSYLGEQRLADGVRALGSRFTLARRDELAGFGFGPRERPILDAVLDGCSASLLDAITDVKERRLARAVVYALATCGVLQCEGHAIPPTGPISAPPRARRTARIADGTPPPRRLRPVSLIEASLAAFRRGESALRAGNLDEAVGALERATELVPEDLEVRCTLAWARFCAATDKASAAAGARAVLRHAIEISDHPVLPHYLLGLVEGMAGSAFDSRVQFECVLVLDPEHDGALRQLA